MYYLYSLSDINLLTDKTKYTLNLLVHPPIAQILTMNFATALLRITTRVHNILKTCIEDPSGALFEPLEYEEVSHVYWRLKPDVASISTDYEHNCYAGPPL